VAPDNGIGYEEVQKNRGDTTIAQTCTDCDPEPRQRGATRILTVRQRAANDAALQLFPVCSGYLLSYKSEATS